MLEWIENKKHHQAEKRLCHKVNQLSVRMVGGLNVELSFHIVGEI